MMEIVDLRTLFGTNNFKKEKCEIPQQRRVKRRERTRGEDQANAKGWTQLKLKLKKKPLKATWLQDGEKWFHSIF